MFDSLPLMISGMFFMMFGGWLLCLCTYRGMLFGFIYGLCSPVFKSIVMWRKSTIFRLASIVIVSLFSLKILQTSFLTLYRPMFIPNCSSCESMYSPTSSHVSAPSLLPIVTSKFEFFLHHAVYSLYNSDCLLV